MLHVFLTPVQLRWTVGVFFAAVVGTLLPFAIHRHFSKTADRLLAVSSAFTGGVCSSVAFFLCQEGTQQLQLFWGARIAAKLGPSTSILSYLAIYSINFFGKYLENPAAAAPAMETTDYDNQPHSQSAYETSLDDLKQPFLSDHQVVLNEQYSGTVVPEAVQKRRCPHHKHHHSCTSLPLGAPYFFSKSLNMRVTGPHSKASQSSTSCITNQQIDGVSKLRPVRHSACAKKSLQPSLIDEEAASGPLRERLASSAYKPASQQMVGNNKTFVNETVLQETEEIADGRCLELCCDSDEELCLEECSTLQNQCSHALGLHPLTLFKTASATLARAFQTIKQNGVPSESSLHPSMRCADTGLYDSLGKKEPGHNSTAPDVELWRSTPSSDAWSSSFIHTLKREQSGTQLTGKPRIVKNSTPCSNLCPSEREGARLAASEVLRSGNGTEQHAGGVGSTCVALLLFFCFSTHSLIEGIGLGSTKEIGALGTGIALHKTLAGFAVGASLLDARLSKIKLLCASIVFSLMTPLGTFLGSLISVLDAQQTYRGLCTSVAGGTFFYIALAELVPKAFKRTQDQLLKLVALFSGALLILSTEVFML